MIKLGQRKEFDLGDILSVTHDKLVSPRHITGVYDILNFMTGENLFTHALPRAAAACKPVLLSQHPQLRDVNLEGVTSKNWRKRMDALYMKYGRTLPIEPCLPGAYEACDPMDEPILKVKKVIPVSVDP